MLSRTFDSGMTMGLSDARWKSITPSTFTWEQDALTFIRERLPDYDPYRAWSNFEFIADDGTINEVDLLVLSPVGFFLVEIKSWPGMLRGDLMTWVVEHDGRAHTHDNPLFLANRKAKKLAALLRRQKGAKDIHVPFIEPLVFLSHENIRCHLPPGSRTRVTVRDRENAGAAYPSGIISALTSRAFEGAADTPQTRIDRPLAKAVVTAIEQAGIHESHRSRRVGDYLLKELLFDAPNGVYQDWLGEHVQSQEARRIRIYTASRAASEESRELTRRAANREYQILSALVHPSMPQVETPVQHDLGTALLFRIRKNATRLDHLFAEKGDSLSVDFRFVLVRELAEAMKYAHEKKIYHRALSPQSVFVTNVDTSSPQVQIFNWQASSREGSSSGPSRVSATRHIEDLVESASMAYVAPESLSDPDAAGEQLDAFSLGAIAYFIFSGKAPAASPLELIEKIRDGQGLRISSVLDGAGEAMQELVQLSTHPDTMLRPDSVDDFLKLLDAVEDELTTPTDDEEVANPLDARKDDTLPGGYVVKRRLGKGSSATALLVEKDKREVVLKVVNGPEKNDRIRAEAETLKKLSHPNIAQFFETVTFEKANLAGFTMEYAGERNPDKNQLDLDASLADRLRKEGALQLELLENLGSDLIEAVRYLEQKGVAHRDIKPENAGVGVGSRKDRTRLVLYDFSLSRAPLTEIHAGTPPYLDPYLPFRPKKRWDSHAERYAVAMTLYEMTTGSTPKFSEGNPAARGTEVPVEAERFDATLRERFTAFFRKGFRSNPAERFDNADEMLGAWREIFRNVEQPALATITRDDFNLDEVIAAATPGTSVLEFGLSARAANALDRIGVRTAEELLRFSLIKIHRQRGVGTKTRREIVDLVTMLRARFPDLRQESEPTEPVPLKGVDDAEPEVGSIDLIVKQLIGNPRDQEKAEKKILNHFLGVDLAWMQTPFAWKNQTEVARHFGLTRARVGQVVTKGRDRWRRNPSIRSVRDELVALLDSSGGVLTVREASLALVGSRGSSEVDPIRAQHGSSVVRAALEAESTATEPRFGDRRIGDLVLIARSTELADLADRLGRAADKLSAEEPLAAPARVVETLRQLYANRRIALSAGVQPMTDARLARLAVEASLHAALSSKGEIYPKGMDAERALNLASGALYGAKRLTVEDIQNRVASRYPEAQPLPRRPALDLLLEAQNLSLEWDEGSLQYMYQRPDITTELSGSSSTGTILPAAAYRPDSEERVSAKLFEERLTHALADGGFLVLTTQPKKAAAAERKLAARFGLDVKNLDAIVIGAMRDEAQENEVDWRVVIDADGAAPRSSARNNLAYLVSRAVPRILERMKESRTPLFSYPGLLARYDRMDLIEKLRDEVGTRSSPVHGAWLLVAADAQAGRPVVDGVPVPILSASQWAPIPDAWIDGVLEGQ